MILTDAIQTLTLPVIDLSERLTGVEQCDAGRVGEGYEYRVEMLELSTIDAGCEQWVETSSTPVSAQSGAVRC
jgi:hypothetical protein